MKDWLRSIKTVSLMTKMVIILKIMTFMKAYQWILKHARRYLNLTLYLRECLPLIVLACYLWIVTLKLVSLLMTAYSFIWVPRNNYTLRL